MNEIMFFALVSFVIIGMSMFLFWVITGMK